MISTIQVYLAEVLTSMLQFSDLTDVVKEKVLNGFSAPLTCKINLGNSKITIYLYQKTKINY